MWLDEHPILHVSSWWFVVQRRLSPVSPASRVFPGRAYRSSNLRTSATSPPCFAISTWKRTFEHVCNALKGRNPNHRNNAVHCEAADLTPPHLDGSFFSPREGEGENDPPPLRPVAGWEFLLSEKRESRRIRGRALGDGRVRRGVRAKEVDDGSRGCKGKERYRVSPCIEEFDSLPYC